MIRAFAHRDHDSHRAHVEHVGDEVVLGRGDADDRDQLGLGSCGDQHADRLDTPTGVFHVEDGELGPGVGGDTCDAGRVELEQHRADRDISFAEFVFDRVANHEAFLGDLIKSVESTDPQGVGLREFNWSATWSDCFAAVCRE